MWWKKYHRETPLDCFKWTGDNNTARLFGIDFVSVRAGKGLCTVKNTVHSGKNSGYQAINLAYHLGAERIILIGYDMQRTNGLSHWHGDHPQGLGNGGNLASWVDGFRQLDIDLKSNGIELINCTISTALDFLDCRKLEQCF